MNGMVSVAGVVLVLLAVALLAAAVHFLRSSSRHPWPPMVVAALASGVCFTVGGDSERGAGGPDIAIIMGSVAGLLSVVAAILALLPKRSLERPASRAPVMLSAGGIILGAIGLLVNLLTS